LKTYEVTFLTPDAGPRKRTVWIGMQAARALFLRFGRKPLRELFLADVLGADDEGRLRRRWDPDVQIAAITTALAAADSRQAVPEDTVALWLDQHVAAGGDVLDVVFPVVKAAFYSGAVTGTSQDLDAAEAGEVGKGAAGAPAAVRAGE
jgi:hypothetical protein